MYRQFTSVGKKEIEEERIRIRNLLLYGDTENADKHKDVEVSAEKTNNENTIYVPSVP